MAPAVLPPVDDLPALPPTDDSEPPVVPAPPVALPEPLAPTFEPPVPCRPPEAPELLAPPLPSLEGSEEHAATDNQSAVTEIRCFEYKPAFVRSSEG
jgi:hypothetical protein